jgi:hypothetical protein
MRHESTKLREERLSLRSSPSSEVSHCICSIFSSIYHVSTDFYTYIRNAEIILSLRSLDFERGVRFFSTDPEKNYLESSRQCNYTFSSVGSVPLHAMEALGGERKYSSCSFLTSALEGGEWSASRPGHALPPVPTGQEAGWAPEPVWTQRLEEKSSASVGDRTPVVQSVVSLYIDWATPAPIRIRELLIYLLITDLS